MVPGQERKVIFGFLGAAVISLIGGIYIFAFVVPRDMEIDGAPRDVVLAFTEVFSQQGSIFQETHKYSPDIRRVADMEFCGRNLCLLRVAADGSSYEMRISREGKTWSIGPKSPVPVEVKE